MRQPSIEVVDLAIQSPDLFTDAEVFQELLHRYLAQRRWTSMRPAVARFYSILAGRIEPVSHIDTERAGVLADQYPRLASRDLVHLALMERVGSQHIVTTDRAFDDVAGIERLDPAKVEEWRSLVTERR